MSSHAAKTFLVACCIALVACGSSGDAASSSSEEAAAVDETASTVETETSVDADEPEEPAEPPPPAFPTLATEPTEPGPRPLLAWASTDGATTYDLIVLDAAGSPYWAWSGEDTSVYLGGVENPDAVGAWVFEPLTWIVTARDADGQPLAMSERAELLP